jgi:hypothetical protein
LGVRGLEVWLLSCAFRELRVVGNGSSAVGGEAGNWWRKVVRM